MTIQTIEREELHQLIQYIPEERIPAALLFMRDFCGVKHISNDDGFYDPANISWLEHSLEQAKQGKVVIKTIEELERMENE